MDNTETLATQDTQYTERRTHKAQHRDTANTGHTRHRMKTNKTQHRDTGNTRHRTKNTQNTTQRHWQHRTHQTQNEDKQNTTHTETLATQGCKNKTIQEKGTLFFISSIFLSWMVTFLWSHHMAFTFLSLQFLLHVFVIMFRASITVIS